ncbi:MAG: HAMP domain-containing protein [Rubrobacteraceae bacterium]|nr:HAMP domain-containing protein [Rubrobacteraceae bacterium]
MSSEKKKDPTMAKPRALRLPGSLRARLTLWHALILGVVLVAFAAAVYAILANSLYGQVRQSLVERARQVNDAVRPRITYSHFSPGVEIFIPPPNTFASSDTFVQVSTPDGRVLGTSENLGGRTLPEDPVTSHSGRPDFRVVRVGGEEVEVYSSPLVVDGRTVGVVQVGRSLAPVRQTLSQLRLLAGVGLLAALVLSVGVVSFMAGETLRPLRRLMSTAESIGSSRDLSRRVKLPDSGDEVGRLAVTFNEMLRRLEASDRQLRETLEAQRRFVADASHELRTPLTTIRGNAGLLRAVPEMSAADREAALAEIHGESERMSRLVGDLLTLARADAGRALERRPLDLATLAREAVAQARALTEGQKLSLDAPERIELAGDRDALKQLLLILLDNAIKYTPSSGHITVRAEAWRDGGAHISVSDTGEGIAPEHLPHIFERFYRADPARATEGTGLGLSIASWIVRQHGGTIEVESEPGRGSTFTVHLPPSLPGERENGVASRSSAETDGRRGGGNL